MKKRISGLILPLFFLLPAIGQADGYNYRRKIDGVTNNWHSISIPSEMYKNLQSDLYDMRIIGITTAGDTIEAPYILTNLEQKQKTVDVQFEIINQSRIKDTYFYTFEVPTKKTINQIELRFAEDNFDRIVVLEGSNDQHEWYEILSGYRILSINNEYMSYQYSTLNFLPVKYKYLRIHFSNRLKPNLESAILKNTITDSGSYKSFIPIHIKKTINAKEKTTIIDIKLGQKVPVSCISLSAEDKFDYYRPIQIEYKKDSIKSEKGWIPSYVYLYSGVLSSLELAEFCFNSVLTDQLKIVVSNFDNQPLNFGNIKVEGNIYSLTTRFTEKAEYYLYYGNISASMPNYDITLFSENIPVNLKALHLSQEETIRITGDQLQKQGFNKMWLYAIMALIVLVLGGFTLAMIRTMKKTKQ